MSDFFSYLPISCTKKFKTTTCALLQLLIPINIIKLQNNNDFIMKNYKVNGCILQASAVHGTMSRRRGGAVDGVRRSGRERRGREEQLLHEAGSDTGGKDKRWRRIFDAGFMYSEL